MPLEIRKKHIPVLIKETIEILQADLAGTYIDATFGAGGHTSAILEANNKNIVYAFDRDEHVLSTAAEFSSFYPVRYFFHPHKFSQMNEVISAEGINEVDGVLLDIGVSSMQIDDPERGFSFNKNGPLLMTMGKNTLSAAEVVNRWSEDKLAETLYLYGEESAKNALKIAKNIVAERKKKPINTTDHLSRIVIQALGREKIGKIHAATLTFQAIRIVVNEELSELEKALNAGISLLKSGGRMVVISFQGLEDVIIKKVFRQAKVDKLCVLYNKGKAIFPEYHEIKNNPRARSAKIRALIRI